MVKSRETAALVAEAPDRLAALMARNDAAKNLSCYKKRPCKKWRDSHVVDTDALPPSARDGADKNNIHGVGPAYKIRRHVGGGSVNLIRNRPISVLSPWQKPGRVVSGRKLRKFFGELGPLVLNATFLEYYLKHPGCIPRQWKKGLHIYFWGTEYVDERGYIYIRSLYWRGDHWSHDIHWIGGGLGSICPAACLKFAA